MRYIFLSVFAPFCLISVGIRAEAVQHKAQSSTIQNASSTPVDSFYTTAKGFVQEQINLIARIEKALSVLDPNRVRAVRGQVLVQAKAVEGFVKLQDPNFKTTCFAESPVIKNSDSSILCPLYTSSQELLKLAPLLDRILSRRGESALVSELPLVSGERQSDPILSMSPIQRPNLGIQAKNFATFEPLLPPSSPQIIVRPAKKLLANYTQPMQGAVMIPQEAYRVLESAEKYIKLAQAEFGVSTTFHNPTQTAIALDRFAYDLDPKEKQTYSKFLALPQTGIFRVLPHSFYHRPLNTLQNRLSKTVIERYPFPSLGEKNGFNPNLALSIVGNSFQILPTGVDYSFIANLGDNKLEKLDATLKTVTPEIATAFLNYQPPPQLDKIQQERRRFQTEKHPLSSKLLSSIPVKLNNTYLVRLFQYKLSSAVLTGKQLTPQERINIDELLEYQSSDTIIAFRPVRFSSDGSYTVLWRLIKRGSPPQIEDLEAHVKY